MQIMDRNRSIVIKAIADETRMKLLVMLLKNNCCVRALARRLGITEATVSQHLKVLREAGLIVLEKRGRYSLYHVERDVLQGLAYEIEALVAIKRMTCTPQNAGCQFTLRETCHVIDAACDCGGAGI